MNQGSPDELTARVARLQDELGRIQRDLDATNRPRRRRSRRPLLIAVLAAVLVVIVPAGVLANHVFGDVPTNSTFHANIANIARAGITVGCTPTTYCPAASVRRDEMAAFLNRGLGRAAIGDGNGASLTGTYVDVATTSLLAPGAGYALVSMSAFAYTTSISGCPCVINARIGETVPTTGYYFANTLFNQNVSGVGDVYLGTQWLYPIPAQGTYTFRAQLQRFTGSAAVFGDAVITVLWVPFGATGSANYTNATTSETEGVDGNAK
jgi:hypothetical protein